MAETSTRDVLVDRFMHDAASLVARSGPNPQMFEVLGERLHHLANKVGILGDQTLSGIHGATASASIIGRHPDGSVLMVARFPADAPTPIHNHNSWGVVCVLGGSDRYERWERLDDGDDPGRAEIRLAEELTLGPGDVAWFDDPPQDLHAQQGIGEAALELVYFGCDPFAAPRAYFDPRTGIVTYEDANR
jgi:hypothetical protein